MLLKRILKILQSSTLMRDIDSLSAALFMLFL